MPSFLARREDHLQKKLFKTDLPFKLCKIELRNTTFTFLQKNCRFLFCLLQLDQILVYFFKSKALIEMRKMIVKKKLFDVWLGNCSTSKVLIFCRFTEFTKMQLT